MKIQKNDEEKLQIDEEKFPIELLKSDNQTRLEHFNDVIVDHWLLRETVEKTMTILASPIKERLIFICAPSGAGKKEVINSLTKQIIGIATPILSSDPGCIPVVNVEASAPFQGSFNFPNLCNQASNKMSEILLDYRISHKDIESNETGQTILRSVSQKATPLEVLQNALIKRHTKALIINEGQHMFEVASGKKATSTMSNLKSLTNGGQTPIVIIGTYDLINYLEDLDYTATDQIMQRTRIINFPRYNSLDYDEIELFVRSGKRLMLQMPIEQTWEKLIEKEWEYFFRNTLGCIGTLKRWLVDAFNEALISQSKTITKSHLEATKIPDIMLSTMYKSIINGEQKMDDFLSSTNFYVPSIVRQDEFDQVLACDNQKDTESIAQGNGSAQDNENNNTKTIKKSKPGVRKPKRDPVG